MDLFEVLFPNTVETVRLVPSSGENIKRDLPTDGVCEAVIRELLSQNVDEFLTKLMFLRTINC